MRRYIRSTANDGGGQRDLTSHFGQSRFEEAQLDIVGFKANTSKGLRKITIFEISIETDKCSLQVYFV